ncbi:MAG: type I-B CRISPR-associated endonuclease Cas1 [Candidatus Desulfofervidaceae bacterium]|nr:type I-B CRISPR-associated endonuclease Cas1 [Candidatus Desulfofervidaceae bacterium]MDL1970433.1 type I-B CRISPR-associated endonuclease Cas1b [Candidatus Desulfofervidaceae bacterium]
MKKTIYIFSDGELKRKQNTIFFESEKGRKYVPVENTGEILIFGEVSINKRILEFLSQQEIILHFFNHYGYYIGSFYPREHLNSGYMVLKQAEHYLDDEKRLLLARLFVWGALENIKKVLAYYINRGTELEEIREKVENLQNGIGDAQTIEETMAIEGNARDYYYRSFDKILANTDFIFEERTRRPPRNRLNALISFGNSLLYVVTLSEIYKTHLDPRIGYLHTTNFRRFSLNLDVAEVFKPIIVDRLIFTLINKGMIKKSHFEKRLNGIVLNEKGRMRFVEEMDKRLKATIQHKKLRRNVSYRRLIRLELYKLEKHFMDEACYQPFVARW